MQSLTDFVLEKRRKKLKEYNEFCVITPGHSILRMSCRNKEDQTAFYHILPGANIFCFCHGHTRKEINIASTREEMPVFIRSGKNAIIFMLEFNRLGERWINGFEEERLRGGKPPTFTVLSFKSLCLILVKKDGNADKIEKEGWLPKTLDYKPYPERKYCILLGCEKYRWQTCHNKCTYTPPHNRGRRCVLRRVPEPPYWS
jgi:hypothetical protein